MRSTGLARPSTTGGRVTTRGFKGGSYAAFLKVNPASQTAPSVIQAFSTATSATGNRFPFGGICLSSSLVVMASISSPLAGSPATTTAPFSPPAIKVARSFIEKPPFFLFPAWHSTQWARRIGTT